MFDIRKRGRMDNRKQSCKYSCPVSAKPLLCVWLSTCVLGIVLLSVPDAFGNLANMPGTAALSAQENSAAISKGTTGKPVARNAWEEIYYRIASAFSPSNLIELLKSMALESDQAGLASSYAIMLKDQIYLYTTHKIKDPIYTEQVLLLLLDKITELADDVTQENPEIANVIALTLLPSLNYDAVMGSANFALGRLGASEFSNNIIRQLEEINSIITMDNGEDQLDLIYSALGCLNALAEFKDPAAYPVLFQVKHGPFARSVRNKADELMKELQKQDKAGIEEQFLNYTMKTPNLSYLNAIIDGINSGDYSFSDATIGKLNLALLTRMNESTWLVPPSGGENIKSEVLRKTIDKLLTQGSDGSEPEATEQLRQTYFDSDNMNIKLLALQVIGRLKTPEGIAFLQDEISKINMQQRSGSINYTDERILRQLMYSLHVSKDTSPETMAALRDVSLAPYSWAIRQVALDMIEAGGF